MKKVFVAAVLGLGVMGQAQADTVVVPAIPVVGALPVLGPVLAPVLVNVVNVVGTLPLVGQGGLSLPDVPVLGDAALTPVLSVVGHVVGALPGGGNQGGLVIPTLPPLPALPGLPQ